MGKVGVTIPELTGWYSWQGPGRGTAQLRGVVVGQQHIPKLEYTSAIGMSGTPWLYWIRVTSSTHDVPYTTLWSMSVPEWLSQRHSAV